MSMILFQTPTHFFIRSENFICEGIETLVIDKKSTQIQVVKTDELLNQTKRQSSGAILGIVGIMNIQG